MNTHGRVFGKTGMRHEIGSFQISNYSQG